MKIKKNIIYVMLLCTIFANITTNFTFASDKNPYIIDVNLTKNIVTVYGLDESNNYTVPVKAFYCSSGRGNNTPVGTYYTQEKYVWRALYGGVYGQYATRIVGAILFHSVPYGSTSKSSLKTSLYNKLGTADSSGCVRLSVEDAKWIYDNCPLKTQVTTHRNVRGTPIIPADPIKIDTSSPYAGWDPTDPDEKNPWQIMAREEEAKRLEELAIEEARKLEELKVIIKSLEERNESLINVVDSAGNKVGERVFLTYDNSDYETAIESVYTSNSRIEGFAFSEEVFANLNIPDEDDELDDTEIEEVEEEKELGYEIHYEIIYHDDIENEVDSEIESEVVDFELHDAE